MNKKIGAPLIALLIVVVILIGVVGWGVSSYNGLVEEQGTVDQYKSDIETNLQRRMDLIPNLVNTVKGAAAHETEVFDKLTQARASYDNAKTLEDQAAASAQVSALLPDIKVIVESNPELKANENFVALQDQLEGTENRINVARTKYNEAAKNYNVSIKRFPKSLIAGMFRFEPVLYFEAAAGAENPPEVSF